MVSKVMARVAMAMARRREYNRMVAEIEGMSQRDLLDVGAFRGDLIRGAREQVYGRA